MSVSAKRVPFFAASVLLFATIMSTVFPAHDAFASNITSRSLTLQAGASDGGSKPSGVVNHLFTFTLPSTTTIHSIMFQYCTTADIDIGGTCTTPTGLHTDATSSTALGTQTGISFDSLVHTNGSGPGSNGSPYLTSAAGVTPSGSSSASIQLTAVTNQNNTNCGGSENCTFFVRISTYTSTDATGAATDTGTVAASTSTQIQLSGTMPESLIFCAGGSISVNGSGIPDCSTATSGSVSFNQLFSPTDTAYASSQLAASTNALSGYVITVKGPTLTNGSYTIPAIGTTAAISSIGQGQFGMNLAQDTAAPTTGANALNPVSANVSQAPNGSNLMGKAALTPTYSTDFGVGGDASTAKYAFNASGLNTIAASDNGTGTGAPTDAQIFTATYMVNVSGSQVAGTYTSTLTYICTPTF